MLVTDRLTPLRVDGRVVHQVWFPYHWGVGGTGLTKGDSANDVIGISLDANVQIQDSKVGTCDVQPGRRPRGPALRELVADYVERSQAPGLHQRVVTARLAESNGRSAAGGDAGSAEQHDEGSD